MNKFKIILKNLRSVRQISQAKLADEIGVKTYTIQRYEYGEMIPSITIATLIADYFNVTLDYLVGRYDDPPTPFSR